MTDERQAALAATLPGAVNYRFLPARVVGDPIWQRMAAEQAAALADAGWTLVRAEAATLDVERHELGERRAWFVYEAARLAAAAALAPIVPEPWVRREKAFRDQFLDVIARQTGPERKSSPEELHEDWVRAYEAMGWVYGPTRDPASRTHPDMVPYRQLGQLERDKDAVFVALCEIARQWVYDSDREYRDGGAA